MRRGLTCVTALTGANAYVAAIEAVRDAGRTDGEEEAAAGSGMEAIALQDLPQYDLKL